MHLVTATRVDSVLVADDDPLVRRCVVSLLRQLGCTGVAVADGAQALLCLQQRRFDLLLLDISMPVLDGLGVLARVRGQELARSGAGRQRIVMVTAHAEPEDGARLCAAGADGHIVKPIDAASFCADVRRFLLL